MKIQSVLCLVAAMALVTACSPGENTADVENAADTIYFGGDILTMDGADVPV